MEPTVLDLYRYLTRGGHSAAPVAAWLESTEGAGRLATRAAAVLNRGPAARSSGLSEREQLRAMGAPLKAGGMDKGHWLDMFASAEGREFAEGLLEYETLPALGKADVVRMRNRAEHLLEVRAVKQAPVYRVVLDELGRVGEWVMHLLDVPAGQLAYAAVLRATPPAKGQKVRAVTYHFDNGVTFLLSFVKGAARGSTQLRIRHQVHFEDHELQSATVNRRTVRIVDGEGQVEFAKLPATLTITATDSCGVKHRFGVQVSASK